MIGTWLTAGYQTAAVFVPVGVTANAFGPAVPSTVIVTVAVLAAEVAESIPHQRQRVEDSYRGRRRSTVWTAVPVL